MTNHTNHFVRRQPIELELSKTEITLMVALLHMSLPMLPCFSEGFELLDLIEKQIQKSIEDYDKDQDELSVPHPELL